MIIKIGIFRIEIRTLPNQKTWIYWTETKDDHWDRHIGALELANEEIDMVILSLEKAKKLRLLE